MVLGLNSQSKVEAQRFDREMVANEEANALDVASKMTGAAQIAYDAQVSAQILGIGRRFLQYKEQAVRDNEGNIVDMKLVCMEKFCFREPYLDESLSALDDTGRFLLNDMDNTLSIIYNTVKKYENDSNRDNVGWCAYWVNEFNTIVSSRSSLLINSRATGKNMKLAKSQYVETAASINRGMGFSGQSKPKRFLGIF